MKLLHTKAAFHLGFWLVNQRSSIEQQLWQAALVTKGGAELHCSRYAGSPLPQSTVSCQGREGVCRVTLFLGRHEHMPLVPGRGPVSMMMPPSPPWWPSGFIWVFTGQGQGVRCWPAPESRHFSEFPLSAFSIPQISSIFSVCSTDLTSSSYVTTLTYVTWVSSSLQCFFL